MQMTYWMPTKILMEKQAVLKNKQEFIKYGKKALIVTGKNAAKKSGALADTEYVLKQMAIAYVIFDEIEQNPSTQTVERAAIVGRKEQVDFVIGIGGGSPLDAAKAIGVMIKNKYLTAENLFTDEKLESIPILAIPTTSGTGSETTPYAILTDHKAQTKRNLGQSIFCKVAFLDAAYTECMPDQVTINTALDAMTHLVESYLNTNSTILSDFLAEKGLMLWGECIPQLLDKNFNLETREKLMLASSIAGMAIAQTGTSLPHGMGYALTYYKGIPHGLANAVLFKAYLRNFKSKIKVEKIFQLLGLAGQDAFEEFLSQVIQLDIKATDFEMKSWSDALCRNQTKLKNHPELVTHEDIYAIYSTSLENKEEKELWNS